MQHSQNYNLNLFEAGDPVLAESFNQTTAIVDLELAKRRPSAALRYEGNGESSREHTFASKPQVVFFWDETGVSVYHRIGMAFRDMPYMLILTYGTAYTGQTPSGISAIWQPIEWTDNGVILSGYAATESTTEPFNLTGKFYNLLAIL